MSQQMSSILPLLPTLREFICTYQIEAMASNCRGEEASFFIDKFHEIHKTVTEMPVTYGQDGKGDQAIAYLHYFAGGYDWYITEKDSVVGEPQCQAFGLVNMHCTEIGYISIEELIENRVELDLHFTPKTLGEIKLEKR